MNFELLLLVKPPRPQVVVHPNRGSIVLEVKNTISCIQKYSLNITDSKGLEYLIDIPANLLNSNIALEDLQSDIPFDFNVNTYTITLSTVYNNQTETSFPIVLQQISGKH